MVESEPCPLPPRHHDHPRRPAVNGLDARAGACSGVKRLVCPSSRKAGRRTGPVDQLAEIALVGAVLVEPLDQRQIDPADFLGQRSARSASSSWSRKGQQVFLAVGVKNGWELIFHRECRLFAIRAVDAHFMTGR